MKVESRLLFWPAVLELVCLQATAPYNKRYTVCNVHLNLCGITGQPEVERLNACTESWSPASGYSQEPYCAPLTPCSCQSFNAPVHMHLQPPEGCLERWPTINAAYTKPHTGLAGFVGKSLLVSHRLTFIWTIQLYYGYRSCSFAATGLVFKRNKGPKLQASDCHGPRKHHHCMK